MHWSSVSHSVRKEKCHRHEIRPINHIVAERDALIPESSRGNIGRLRAINSACAGLDTGSGTLLPDSLALGICSASF